VSPLCFLDLRTNGPRPFCCNVGAVFLLVVVGGFGNDSNKYNRFIRLLCWPAIYFLVVFHVFFLFFFLFSDSFIIYIF